MLDDRAQALYVGQDFVLRRTTFRIEERSVGDDFESQDFCSTQGRQIVEVAPRFIILLLLVGKDMSGLIVDERICYSHLARLRTCRPPLEELLEQWRFRSKTIAHGEPRRLSGPVQQSLPYKQDNSRRRCWSACLEHSMEEDIKHGRQRRPRRACASCQESHVDDRLTSSRLLELTKKPGRILR